MTVLKNQAIAAQFMKIIKKYLLSSLVWSLFPLCFKHKPHYLRLSFNGLIYFFYDKNIFVTIFTIKLKLLLVTNIKVTELKMVGSVCWTDSNNAVHDSSQQVSQSAAFLCKPLSVPGSSKVNPESKTLAAHQLKQTTTKSHKKPGFRLENISRKLKPVSAEGFSLCYSTVLPWRTEKAMSLW